MRILLSLALIMTAAISQAQTVKLDAPELLKYRCEKQANRSELLVPTVQLVIKKAITTQVILLLVEADCINGKIVPAASNTFYKPSLRDLNGENAITAQPRMVRIDSYTYQATLEFYNDQLYFRERQFLLNVPVDGGSYTVIVIMTEDGKAQVYPH